MALRFLVRVGFLAAFLTSFGLAQDIVFRDWEWIGSGEPPDSLPVLKRLGSKLPPQMETSSEYAYVVVYRLVDPDGETADSSALSTSPRWPVKPSAESTEPARRAGKPVHAAFRTIGVFNPAAAAPHLKTRPARLELVSLPDLTPLISDANQRKVVGESAPSDSPAHWLGKTAPVKLAIDASGSVTDCEPSLSLPPTVKRVVFDCVSTWKFQPALQDGQPIESSLSIDVLLSFDPSTPDAPIKAKPPRLKERVELTYPPAFKRTGYKGEVIVSYVVEVDGRTSDLRILSSSHPAFSEAVIEVVPRWVFEPATVNGKPLRRRTIQKIVFSLPDEQDGGTKIVRMSEGDQSKIPEAYRVDVPPVVLGTSRLIHPFHLLDIQTSARFSVVFEVSERGIPSGQMKFGKAPEAFQLAARAMIESLRFVPASRKGQPHPALIGMEIIFDQYKESELTRDERYLFRRLKKGSAKLAKVSDLEVKPEALAMTQPAFPPSLVDRGILEGSATIAFYIDSDGSVLLPHAINATEKEFGYTAIQAVAGWKFKPLKLKKDPSWTEPVVRVSMPFVFKVTAPAPAPAAP